MILKIAFYSFVALTVGTSLCMLLSKNVLYAAFSLLFTLLGVAAIYIFAGADFVALTQIVVYVGGVLVLLLFGIMLTNRSSEVSMAPVSESQHTFLGIFLGTCLFGILAYAIYQVDFEHLAWIQKAQQNKKILQTSSVQGLGVSLMTTYLLAFEVMAVLLLIALVGATMIAGYKTKNT